MCSLVRHVLVGLRLQPFDLHLQLNDPRLNATDRLVSRALRSYWSRFMAAADPNAGGAASAGLPHWPASNRSSNATMRLLAPTPLAERDALRARKCAYWDATHPVPYARAREAALFR